MTRRIVCIAGERCQWALDSEGEIWFYDGIRWVGGLRPGLPSDPIRGPGPKLAEPAPLPTIVAPPPVRPQSYLPPAPSKEPPKRGKP